jgi:hypothetical protein
MAAKYRPLGFIVAIAGIGITGIQVPGLQTC